MSNTATQTAPRTSAGLWRLDAEQLKSQAAGRWREILVAAGCPEGVLDGRNHHCPLCGGRDRFRMVDASRGFLYCNQCFRKGSDGLSAIAWLRSCTFRGALEWLDDYLANGESDGRKPKLKPIPSQPRKKETKTYATEEQAVFAMGAAMKRSGGKLARLSTYRDLDGEPVGYVLRFDLPTPEGEKQRKTFLQVTKHPEGWKAAKPPGKWPLYNIFQAVHSPCVYIHEGEKAADALQRIGYTSVTSAGGSNSVHLTDWTPLAGKLCVICPDNDDAGKRYAADVRSMLAKLKPRPEVHVAHLEGLPSGGDAADWVAKHFS